MSDADDDGDISLSFSAESHDGPFTKGAKTAKSVLEPSSTQAGEEGGDLSIALDEDGKEESETGVPAAEEPVPLDIEQVASAVQPARQDEDVTAGAWSVSVTPVEEVDGIHLDGQGNADPHEHSDHHDIDLSDDSQQSLPKETHRSSHDTAAYYDTRRPSILSMDEEVNLNSRDRQYQEDAYHEYRSRHNVQQSLDIDTMGMRFEDVMLDGQQAPNAIYGQGGVSAAKSRSSLEIRSDSISSDGRQKTPAAVSNDQTRGLRFWRKSATDDAVQQDPPAAVPASSSSTTQPSRYPPEDLRAPDAPSVDELRPAAKSPHRVAGRYKGRLSTPVSPAGSPQLSRSSWLPPVEAANSNPPSIVSSSGVTMMVAGEDGEIEVTEIEEAQTPVNAPSTDSPSDIKIPEPKASSNESQEAVDVKVSEHVAAASQETGTQPPRGGRSAGPFDGQPDDIVLDADVRQDTPAEVESRQQAASTSRGGRSAGPVSAASAAAAEETAAPSAASPPSSAATTSRSGGRSAGPLLDSTPSKATHARKLSNGPSALEKHMSRTRQATLPPKTRTEDQRHLRDFEAIMREYKAAEAKRQKEDEERQRQKEAELREATKVWEDEILKDWKVARSNARLRDVWWKGAPPSLRGRVWQLAIGNMQMLPRNLCTTTKNRVMELKKEGKWPPRNALSEVDGDAADDVETSMHADIERTLPSLKLFQEHGPMHDDLKEMLECLVLLRADQAEEISRTKEASSRERRPAAQLYVTGLSLLSAMLLLNLSQSEALIALLNLIHSKLWLQGIYSMDTSGQDASEAFERVLNTFLADQLPKVYANMQASNVSPSHYAREWVQNLFVPLLPLEVVSRLWDNIVLEEGDSLIVRSCLALVALLSSRLYVSDGLELTSILQGRNRAALAAWYRSLQSAPAKDHASVQAVASLPNSPLSPSKNGRVVALPPVLEQQQQQQQEEGVQRTSNGTEEHPESEESTSTPTSSSPSIPLRSSSRLEPPSTTPIEAPTSWVPRDSILSIYGIDEDKLFSTLEEQVGADGWWRQSTMDRLVDRELGG